MGTPGFTGSAEPAAARGPEACFSTGLEEFVGNMRAKTLLEKSFCRIFWKQSGFQIWRPQPGPIVGWDSTEGRSR